MSVSGNKDTQCQSNLNKAAINNTMTSHKGSDEEDFPNEEEAITIDVSENIKPEECTVAIGKLIGPSNINFASEKITDGKMCFYLKSQKSVRKLLDNHKHVNIGNHTLELRPLLQRFKLFTIPNLSPIVPHWIIEMKLTEINVSYTPIVFKKFHINEYGYEHIRSFDRLTWINAEDVNKLTNATQIKFEDTVYHIHWQEIQHFDLYAKKISTGKQLLTVSRARYLMMNTTPGLPSADTIIDKLMRRWEWQSLPPTWVPEPIHQTDKGLNEEKRNLKPPNVSGKRALSPTASSSSTGDPITQDNQLLSSQNSDTQTSNKKHH